MKGWLGRVWAIARMTLIEASRRAVFWVLPLFAVWLLYSLTELHGHEPADRLRVVQSWSVQTITLFTTLVALFTVGFSLPSDFEEKRIYMLVSKPVEKVTLFLGRYFGFSLMLVILMAFMGIASIVYIRLVQWTGGPDFPAPIARPRVLVPDRGFGHEHGRRSRLLPGHRVIDYTSDGVLAWQYQGLHRQDFGRTVEATATLVLQSSDPKNPFRVTGNALFRISSDRGDTEIPVFAQSNEEFPLTFPADLIDDTGGVRVSVKCADADGLIRAGRESVVLYGPPGSFELNFLKGLVLSLFQTLLVLTITLSASTFLSAPTSILMGLMLFLVGMSHGWISDGVRDIQAQVERDRENDGHRHRARPDELPEDIVRVSGWISGWVLKGVPDFDRFDFSAWMLKDRAIPWSTLVVRGGYAMVPISVLALAGILIIHFKALG